MRKKYIIANWKANPQTVIQADSLGLSIARFVHSNKKKISSQVIIACPFAFIDRLKNSLDKTRVGLAAQDFFNQARGAFTAQVTAPMLSSLKVKYIILGHSEVREENGDDNTEINHKLLLAYKFNLIPVLCLGEKKKGAYKSVLEKQLRECLNGVKEKDIKKTILCYEPIWAISKGKSAHKAAKPEDAQNAHVFLRKLLTKKYSAKVAEEVSIIYGGSIKPSNAKKIFNQLDIDGGLVGSSSLSITKFSRVIKSL